MIPLYKPYISKKLIRNVNNCIRSTWISSKGPYIKKFEKSISKFTGIKYSISVTNGTCAMHLALLSLGIKDKDEVIVPSFTYIGTVNPIIYVGAKPIFIDTNLNTLQIDINDIEKKISSKTKAIICPHIYGNMAEMQKIINIKKKYKIYLIEDCAESLGSYYKKKHSGNFGDISTFSFYGNKTISTGEGGMVCTNNHKLARLVFKLKTQGLKSNQKLYYHDIIGYNYRMTNVCAAIGLSQINQIKKILKRKKEIYNKYLEGFKKNLNLQVFGESKNVKSSYWLVVIILKKNNFREKLIQYLKKNRIETRPTFSPIHKMPMYNKKLNTKNADHLGKNGICLPSFPQIKNNQIKHIIKTINHFFNENK